MFRNIFCSDYFGFSCPLDCAKQINIQNTLLIKLSSLLCRRKMQDHKYKEKHFNKCPCLQLTHPASTGVWLVHEGGTQQLETKYASILILVVKKKLNM